MTAKWRIRIGTAITAALIIALAAYGAWRVREWNARGWAGLTFVPDIAKWQHFRYPRGVATDRSGNVYVPASLNNTIRKVAPAGGVTTVAGLGGSSGHADGIGSAARFDAPEGVATDIEGNVYVADTNNATIRKITPAGVVTTLAGLA